MSPAGGVNVARSRHLRRDGIEGSESRSPLADLPAPPADLPELLRARRVVAPSSVPCAKCHQERPYGGLEAPPAPRWQFWRRPADPTRCPHCGAV